MRTLRSGGYDVGDTDRTVCMSITAETRGDVMPIEDVVRIIIDLGPVSGMVQSEPGAASAAGADLVLAGRWKERIRVCRWVKLRAACPDRSGSALIPTNVELPTRSILEVLVKTHL